MALECFGQSARISASSTWTAAAEDAVREVLAYSALFERLTVVEVDGRVDFAALAPIVDDLLAGRVRA
jgi:hypothetical protein